MHDVYYTLCFLLTRIRDDDGFMQLDNFRFIYRVGSAAVWRNYAQLLRRHSSLFCEGNAVSAEDVSFYRGVTSVRRKKCI